MYISKIKNRIIMFTQYVPGWDLNLYLILGKKYNYIIDTGLGPLDIQEIKNQIKNDSKQTVIINTHYHWDHIWGNCAAGESIIISHKLCREMIKSEWDGMMQSNSRYCHGEVVMHLPDLIFEDELYFAEDKIRLFYTPGHTVDSISILDEEEGILIAGDNIGDNMEEIVPNLDCGKDVYIDTLNKYRRLDFDTCISGHNKVLGKEVIDQILNKVDRS